MEREEGSNANWSSVKVSEMGTPGALHLTGCTGSSKKILAKFSDTSSVRADGLCIGSPRLVGGRKTGNSNMQEFFCTMRMESKLDLLSVE